MSHLISTLSHWCTPTGTWGRGSTSGQKMFPEIKARCGQAGASFRKYKKQLFQNPRISLHKRLFLFNSLVMSIEEFNLGTWSGLSKGEWAYLRKRLMSMHRAIARATVKEEGLPSLGP